MATGRTTLNYWRVYIDGYDMSGYSRSIGDFGATFETGTDDAMSLAVKGMIPGQATISAGTVNAIFDNTATSGIHAIGSSIGLTRDVCYARGVQAAPADNDVTFAGQFKQSGYSAANGDSIVVATIPFESTSALAGNKRYANPFGVLLHAKAAETAANSATGLDQSAQTTLGGWMQYHVFAGNGTAAIKVQDADTNSDGSFGDLLSSGTIDCSTVQHGVQALAYGATVERYVRWQVTLGTATTVTFAISWHRNNL